MSDTISPLLSDLLLPYKNDINAALATRYLTLVAAVIQLVDIFTSHRAERTLIWPLPNTAVKWAFLLNRYMVTGLLIAGFVPLSGFIGVKFSDEGCMNIATIVTFLGVCSMGIMNGLVSLRIITLWDYNPRVLFLMLGSAAMIYAASAASVIVTFAQKSTFAWNPLLNMCIVTKASSLAVVIWAGPMVFELVVLAALIWNALDCPRSAQTTLLRTLRADGVVYYTIITLLRALQTGLIATGSPRTYLLMNGLALSLVAITTNRALFALRRAEEAERHRPRTEAWVGRSHSPFGLSQVVSSDDRKSSMNSIQIPMHMPMQTPDRASPIELMRRVDVEYVHR